MHTPQPTLDALLDDVLTIPGNVHTLRLLQTALDEPNRRLIGVVGATVSTTTLPTTEALLADLLQHAIEAGCVLESSRAHWVDSMETTPLSSAQQLKDQLGAGFEQFMRSRFDTAELASTERTHDLVMALNVSGFIATSYDNYLNAAWQRAFRGIQTHYGWNGFDAAQCQEFSEAVTREATRKVIIHAHGSWEAPADAIAIGNRDYINLYNGAWGARFREFFGNHGAPSLLWIGSPLSERWLETVAAAGLNRIRSGRTRHFGIVPLRSADASQSERKRLQDGFGLEPIFYPLGWGRDHRAEHLYLDAVLNRLAAKEAHGTRRTPPVSLPQVVQLPMRQAISTGRPVASPPPSASSPPPSVAPTPAGVAPTPDDWDAIDNTIVRGSPKHADLRRDFADWFRSLDVGTVWPFAVTVAVVPMLVGLLLGAVGLWLPEPIRSAVHSAVPQTISTAANIILVSLSLLWMRRREPRSTKQSSAKVNDAAQRFVEAWRWVWRSWLLFFVLLAAEQIVQQVTPIGLNAGRYQLTGDRWPRVMLLDLANLVQWVAWYGAYLELDEATVERQVEVSRRKQLLLLGTVGLHALVATTLVMLQASRAVVDVYQCFIGSAVGLGMALFFARLESKYVYPPGPITMLFFVYTLLQPLYFVFDSPDTPYTWLATGLSLFAFVTKGILFLFVFWIYRHGRLLFYLANISAIQVTIDERWRDFHQNDLGAFPEQKPDKATIPLK